MLITPHPPSLAVQDDPISRTQIPQLLTLTQQFEHLAVILIPTDQGYFEPDTSELTRLKLKKEYGFGNAENAIVLDKMDWLGGTASPMLTGYVSRLIPSIIDDSVGIRGNYEKFLIDGATGLPLRRYSKGEVPRLSARDIEALSKAKVGEGEGGDETAKSTTTNIPPVRSGFLETWRAEIDSCKTDTYVRTPRRGHHMV